MKRLSTVIFFLLFSLHIAAAQISHIEWEQKVLINNVPVYTDQGKVSEAGGTAGRHHIS